MKAKEYFNYYKTENQDKSWEWRIVNVLKMCLLEYEQLAEKRKAESEESYIAIFKELNQKANSFIFMVNTEENRGIKKDAFMIFIEAHASQLYELLTENQKSWTQN